MGSSGIVFYNTRRKKKEPFRPIEPRRVRLYSCGPTVYGPVHIGNLRSWLFSDLLKRFLISEGFSVTQVINITDVGHLVSDGDEGEDKMELAARRSGESAEEIAARYTELWRQDRAALGCLEPEHNPRASEHIAEQIELGQKLEAGGYLYRIEDGIYFDVSLFPRYTELAGLDLEGQRDVQRIDAVKGKRHPADFAIWKFAEPGVKRLQEWDSPWGRGFPGWHLECSAMAVKYLGEKIDIHTGGIDLASVHHTNEVAQSECGFGVHPWVRHWMHNEFLDFGGEKMSKSKGNVRTLSDLTGRGYDPMAFRYFFLQAHYRQQQNFNAEAMDAADTGYRRLVAVAAELRGVEGPGSEAVQAPFKQRFRAALADDLNAPRAMAVVWDVARSDTLSPADRRDLLLAFDEVLGLDLAHAKPPAQEYESDPRIDGLVAERQAARAGKDFATADRIRDELDAEGIGIVDTPEGPRWRRK
ncbi:MAG: cysteine--tRNA ligase [Deltaproteobacteria bacterium]|nr:cysteine--tRNA ligase [Deltaproteobacteria bacterium]